MTTDSFRFVGYPVRVHAGADAISSLAGEVDRLSAKRILIVCGQSAHLWIRQRPATAGGEAVRAMTPTVIAATNATVKATSFFDIDVPPLDGRSIPPACDAQPALEPPILSTTNREPDGDQAAE